MLADMAWWIAFLPAVFFGLVLLGAYGRLLALLALRDDSVIGFQRIGEERDIRVKPYLHDTSTAADELGFEFDGFFAEKSSKETPAPIWFGLWRSSDRITLLWVFNGAKVGKSDARIMMLLSRHSNGQWLSTTDAVLLQSISGRVEYATLLNADLYELVQFHRSRLEAQSSTPIMLDHAAAEESLAQLETESTGQLVVRGCARYTDAAQTRYRHTYRGAIKRIAQLGRMHGATAKRQPHRTKFKRPGDDGYEPRIRWDAAGPGDVARWPKPKTNGVWLGVWSVRLWVLHLLMVFATYYVSKRIAAPVGLGALLFLAIAALAFLATATGLVFGVAGIFVAPDDMKRAKTGALLNAMTVITWITVVVRHVNS